MKIEMPDINLGIYKLRTIRLDDYEAYFEFGSDPLNLKYVSWGPYTEIAMAKEKIQTVFLDRPSKENLPIGYAITLKQSDKMIGIIDFNDYLERENAAEIGFILARKYWNMGIMTMCLEAMVKVGFSYQGLDKIIIAHIRENEASRKVILKNHFKYEYTEYQSAERNGIKYDVLYYSIYKDEYERGLKK